jgi:SAM-dependent methyltransferase
MEQIANCVACGSGEIELFFEQHDVPTHSCLLLDTLEQARSFPQGSIRLGRCLGCGFIFNTCFDLAHNAYSSTYEETQGFSPTFRVFLADLARDWIDRYDIHDKNVLEIGCGKGEFIVKMCELGPNRGTGIDPAYVPERTQSDASDRLTFIQDLYSENYVGLDADVIVCRHTLEHIQPVADFMRLARRQIGERTDVVVLFELPDVLRVLKEVAFWDIYYEHSSYFTLGSLARLFRATGFDVVNLSLAYDDQYLLVEARPSQGSSSLPPLAVEDDMDEIAEAVKHFAVAYAATVDKWRSLLRDIVGSGRRVVIWGAGSKGVSYLTTLGAGSGIEYAVDIDPFKHGMFLAGSGQQIVSPEFLKDYRPDVVIAMNPVYRQEIRDSLDELGLEAAELLTV